MFMESELNEVIDPSCRLTNVPTFPTFSYFLIQSPTFPYFLRKQPYYPYFLGFHVVKLNKEHLKHVFLHWFST